MNTQRSFLLFAISLVFDPVVTAHAQAPTPVAANYTTVKAGIFSFDIPTTWREMTARELAIFKQQYEQQSAELYKQYHGRSALCCSFRCEWTRPMRRGAFDQAASLFTSRVNG